MQLSLLYKTIVLLLLSISCSLSFADISISVTQENRPKEQNSAFPEQERINIAFFEYPPLGHLARSGHLSGIAVETVREICFQAGLNCYFRLLPVARVYRSVVSGDAQVIMTGSHPSFDACCRLAQWQYPWSAGIYSRAPESMIAETEDELKYHKMIIIRGWRSNFRYFPNLQSLSDNGLVKLSVAQDSLGAIRMLQRDRAEYMWGGDSFHWYLQKLGLEDEFNFKPLISIPLGLWVDKDRPDILQALNRGFKKMKDKGLLNASHQRLNDELMSQRLEEAVRY